MQAAIPAIATAAILTLLMGLTKQVAEGKAPIDPLGLTKMLNFWPFILVYLWMTAIVGEVTLNQIVHFWKDYGTTYKYSHIDLKVEPLLEDKESVYEGLERLKKHLLETNPDKLAMDEWEIMHYFVDISYKGIKNSDLITSTLTDPDPMIESDYYVNVNTGEVNTDIAKVFTSIYGNFMDFLLVDGSIGHRLRKVSNFDIQKWIKEREEDDFTRRN